MLVLADLVFDAAGPQMWCLFVGSVGLGWSPRILGFLTTRIPTSTSNWLGNEENFLVSVLDLGLERVPLTSSSVSMKVPSSDTSGLSNLHPVVTHTYLLIRSKEIFKMRKRKIAHWGSRLLSLNIFRGHWKRIFSRRDYFWQNSNKTKKNLRQIVNVEDKTSQKWQVNFHLSMSIARAINSRFF